jgi:signal transduction histidine kinase
MEVQLADVNVAQLVATQCDMARPLTEKKNIDLETHVQAGLSPMYQDQGRAHQILNNLLSNAIKFTPEGGRIRVTAEKSPREELVLKVIDTGVGIAEEDQQTIFEKFRQGSAAAPSGDAITREYSGTGLGLSIVKELCRLLGGEVSVQSALGTGSTFTVRLPWRLEKQPRLDSPLMAGLEEFAKPRIDARRETIPEPLSAATEGVTSNDNR